MTAFIPKAPGRRLAAGVDKLQRHSTRIDLTPMVDLGFLLITFFIFSITMNSETSMTIVVPDDTKAGAHMDISRTGALTLLLADSSRIYYYQGDDMVNIRETTFQGAREVILEKKKITPPEKLFIIIKPGARTTYRNTVAILDEMNINGVSRYAVVDPEASEIAFLRAISR